LIDSWEFYDYDLGGGFMRLASHTATRSLYSESGRRLSEVFKGNRERYLEYINRVNVSSWKRERMVTGKLSLRL